MLRNIDPILSPDLLHALRAMGHGDDIVIADANFPAESIGPRCIRADGSSAGDVLKAVLSVMPLDTFVSEPALTMQVVGNPDEIPQTRRDFQALIDAEADNAAAIATLERFAFYERAAQAFTVVQTGERRLYGNIILTKGVVA